VFVSYLRAEEDDANVGQYWEVQEGGKRQRKSLEHFKVEAAKPEKEIVKGTGGRVLSCLSTRAGPLQRACMLATRSSAQNANGECAHVLLRMNPVVTGTTSFMCRNVQARAQASCAPFILALQSHAADVASRASSHLSGTLSNRAGKPLKDIPAVVDLIQLHTIKKADKDDPLKVRVDSEEGSAYFA